VAAYLKQLIPVTMRARALVSYLVLIHVIKPQDASDYIVTLNDYIIALFHEIDSDSCIVHDLKSYDSWVAMANATFPELFVAYNLPLSSAKSNL